MTGLEKLEFLSGFVQNLLINEEVCVVSTDESKVIRTNLKCAELEPFYGKVVVNLSNFVKQIKLVNFKVKPTIEQVFSTPENQITSQYVKFSWGKESINVSVWDIDAVNNVDLDTTDGISSDTSIEIELTDYKNILSTKAIYGAERITFQAIDSNLYLIIKNANFDDEYKRLLKENIECDDMIWMIDPPSSNINWKISIYPDNGEFITFKSDEFTIIAYNKSNN